MKGYFELDTFENVTKVRSLEQLTPTQHFLIDLYHQKREQCKSIESTLQDLCT